MYILFRHYDLPPIFYSLYFEKMKSSLPLRNYVDLSPLLPVIPPKHRITFFLEIPDSNIFA